MQSEPFEAFRAIDIPEERALRAAAGLSKRDDDVVDINRDLADLKWTVATLHPLVIAIPLKLFLH